MLKTKLLKSCLNLLHIQSNKNVRSGFICVFLLVLVRDSYYVLWLISTLRPFCSDLIMAEVGLESLVFFFVNTLLAYLPGRVRKYLALIFREEMMCFNVQPLQIT